MKQKPNKPKQDARERPLPGRAPPIPAGPGWGQRHFWTKCPQVKVSAEKQTEQAAASKLRMEERGEKLERAKDKLAKQKPPKKPGPVRRIGRAAGGPPTVLCMARFMRMEQKRGDRGGPPLRAGGRVRPAAGKRFVQRKSGSTRQRLSSGPSPNMSRPRRTIISAWPPRAPGNVRQPCSQMWRKHRLKKQYQKRAREAAKTGAASAAKRPPPPRKRPGQRSRAL